MTTNQIKYQELLEQRRTNRMNEEIKDWANKKQYEINLQDMAIKQQDADTRVKELGVHQQQANTAENQQREQKRHNLTTEYYQGVAARQQTRSLDQQDRKLTQQDRSLDQQDRSLDIGAYGAQTSRLGVGVQQSSVAEMIRHNREQEALIPSQIAQNYAGAVRSGTGALSGVVGLGLGAAGATALGKAKGAVSTALSGLTRVNPILIVGATAKKGNEMLQTLSGNGRTY